jgi:biofilm PGA synthesis N-glycosyltransferase PgaC
MTRNSKIIYLVFCIPFILTYLSWQFFPVFARWLLQLAFGYKSPNLPANWLWSTLILFFYSWYTFLSIGVAGVWALAALFAENKQSRIKRTYSPMVSFVVPAHNEEQGISRCITSLFKCAEEYDGLCEIIIVDDGSTDFTYEVAWASLEYNRDRRRTRVPWKVARHCMNLGKVEAIRTGVNSAMGGLIAVVDADSWWLPATLDRLVDYLLTNGKKAVTGYIHPSDGDSELNPYVVLQELEYSQGQGVTRNAQSLGNNVVVVPGAIGLYDAHFLRAILNEKSIRSVTEDLEITLEMHKRGAKIGYVSAATSSTLAPLSFNALWNQRMRWFTGWLHNTLSIHRDVLMKRSKLALFLWYCYVFEYGGALIDLAAWIAFPFLFWFAPDRIFFALNLLMFLPYGLFLGVINQAIALKYAYNDHNYRSLLFYTPFYPILRLINIFVRLTSSIKYLFGERGNWHQSKK